MDMRFEINKPREGVVSIARKIGYTPQRAAGPNEVSLIRPLERGGYPRFHLYVKELEKALLFNLHLDQKRPIYAGTSAHGGEYEGEVVEAEAARIKSTLTQ
ncbi:MAG: hypothetical protein HYS87_03320 [Candidatus Colwellbacteria bacterium]|nr:hypothetical protein [Candidatus Colwellbacteria bacterium]